MKERDCGLKCSEMRSFPELGCFPDAAAAANAVDVFAGGDSGSDSDSDSVACPGVQSEFTREFSSFYSDSAVRRSKATTTLSAASSFYDSPEELACVFKCSHSSSNSTAAQGNDSKHNQNYSCTLYTRTRDR